MNIRQECPDFELTVRIWNDPKIDSRFDCPVIDKIKLGNSPQDLLAIAQKHYPNLNWELVKKPYELVEWIVVCYDAGEFEGATILCA